MSSTTMICPTTEILAEHERYEGHPAIEAVKVAAVDRAVRYGIEEVVKYTKQLGFCWLVAGGPRKQWYRSEARIIADWERKQAGQEVHDPSCSPAYLCQACVDKMVSA